MFSINLLGVIYPGAQAPIQHAGEYYWCIEKDIYAKPQGINGDGLVTGKEGRILGAFNNFLSP
jgi:hypothetical protein